MNYRQYLMVSTAVVPLVCLLPGSGYAAPQGGSVAAGQATISQSGNSTVIQQNSGKAIINWQSFSTNANETVQFVQPSSQSITLNRVTGTAPSSLYGQLLGNGQVWLINPNGVLIGSSGVINVGGFLATTSSISDQSFLSGQYSFTSAPNGSSIVNQGRIQTGQGGSVVLSAPVVQNSGSIESPQGSVALGAAQSFAVDINGDGLLRYQIGDPAAQASILNNGSISATGGSVLLAARTADTVNRSVINTTGLVEANSVGIKDGEVVFDGGTQGTVSISGQVQTKGNDSGESGGSITVKGDTVAIANGASLDASGQAGGGTIKVGDWSSTAATVASTAKLDASATANGNGGTISVISGKTDVTGTLLAEGGAQGGNGGSIETSGHTLSIGGALINAGAPRGKAGLWLLDPYDLTIDASAANTINTALGTNSVTLQTTAGGTSGPGTANASGNGDINIDAPLSWSANTLTLDAYRNININANMSVGGTGSLAMFYGTGTTGYDLTASGNSVTFTGGSTLSINGNPYTLITDAASLQGIGTGGYYALANNIDLSGISNFTPIASGSSFSGNLDGLGHSVTSLTVSGSGNLGLLSAISSGTYIQNIFVFGTMNCVSNYCGLIAGTNGGTIINVGSTGTVTGSGGWGMGGLVGENTGSIDRSYSISTVNGGSGWQIGGIVGYNYNLGSITNSYSISTVSGDGSRIGGFVGENYLASISSSYTKSNVSSSLSSGADIGVFVGDNGSSITSSYSIGSISGGSRQGGFVGYNAGTIASSFSSSTLSDSGTSYSGGMVAYNDSTASVSSSYWDSTKYQSGNGWNSGTYSALGLSSSQTGISSSYSGWDFTNTWYLGSGGGTPLLRSIGNILTITPNSASMTYGASLPTLTASYSGLNNGDTASVVSGLTLATSANSSSILGTYNITASGASATNYQIAYDLGTLTVNPAVPTTTVLPTTVTVTNTASPQSSGNSSSSPSISSAIMARQTSQTSSSAVISAPTFQQSESLLDSSPSTSTASSSTSGSTQSASNDVTPSTSHTTQTSMEATSTTSLDSSSAPSKEPPPKPQIANLIPGLLNIAITPAGGQGASNRGGNTAPPAAALGNKALW